MKAQLDTKWDEYRKDADYQAGHNAANMLTACASVDDVNAYLYTIEKTHFFGGDEKYKWYSRGEAMLASLKSGKEPSKEEQNEALGICAIAAKTLDNEGAYNDLVYTLQSQKKLTGSLVNTAFGYWKKDDSILKSEIDRIDAWKKKDSNGHQAMTDEQVAYIS